MGKEEMVTAEKDEKQELAEKIHKIKDESLPKARRNRGLMILLLVATLIGVLYSLVKGSFDSDIYAMMAMSLIFGPYAFFLDKRSDVRKFEEQLRQYEDELDLLDIAEGDNVRRSEKLFRNNQRELKRYYDINLGHYRLMLPVGIAAVILGMALIGGTIIYFRDSIKIDIVPVLIGAVSGVLVDFVGAVLIHMYSETVKASIAFHSQLMKSNHALFANMLAFKIKDNTKQDETFAELAKLMIQSNVEPQK